MMQRALALFACMILCSISVPVHAEGLNWGTISLRLSEDMTEQQVISAIGYLPDKAEQTTCGQRSSTGSWDCRVLTFGDRRRFNYLEILMRRSDGLWVVNSWEVKP